MNRIINAVAKMELQIKKRLKAGATTQERVDATWRSLDLNTEEHARFQETKSLAVASEVLSLEEGMTIFGYLGGNASVFNGQSVAVKAVLTKTLMELMTLERAGV